MKFYGIGVNYRHLALLADTMTYRGSIMSINRHGLNRTDAGPLKKCTFEETVDMLLDAGKKGMTDDLESVSASIIVGKEGKFGTGIFDLRYNDSQSSSRFKSSRRESLKRIPKKRQRTSQFQSNNSFAIRPVSEITSQVDLEDYNPTKTDLIPLFEREENDESLKQVNYTTKDLQKEYDPEMPEYDPNTNAYDPEKATETIPLEDVLKDGEAENLFDWLN